MVLSSLSQYWIRSLPEISALLPTETKVVQLRQWIGLQKETPEDYVVATEQSHSVKDLVANAFAVLDLDWEEYVVVDEQFFRPAEIFQLRGDATKARQELGWR